MLGAVLRLTADVPTRQYAGVRDTRNRNGLSSKLDLQISISMKSNIVYVALIGFA
jgi:hypothetical protein